MELNITNIYNSYYNKVKTDILCRVKNVETAEDLAAEVFVKINNNLTTFDEAKATIGTWINSITKNLVIDYYRKRKLNAKSMCDLSDDEGKEFLIWTNSTDPETEMINNQLGNIILEAITSLPEIQMNVIDLFMVEQLSHEEISDSLEMPIGTVKATIFRAKEALRNKLSNL